MYDKMSYDTKCFEIEYLISSAITIISKNHFYDWWKNVPVYSDKDNQLINLKKLFNYTLKFLYERTGFANISQHPIHHYEL